MVILPEGDEEGARRVVEGIRARVARLRAGGDGGEVTVSLSAGITQAGPEVSLAAGHDGVLAAADAALLEAKRAGGGEVRFHG